MLKPHTEYIRLSGDAFAEDVMPKGTIVSARATGRLICVEKCRMKEPYGILLNDVVDIDLRCTMLINPYQVQKGGKVLIMHEGVIITSNIDSSFKNVELLTKIYVDLRTGKFTTKKHKFTSDKVGHTLSYIDNDRYIKLSIRF